MKNQINKFNLGDIVTDVSHPLLYRYRIQGDGKYVPPFMVVKEILFENKQKKTHDDITGKQIAERIKYMCTYFDDNRSEFVDVCLYEKMLISFTATASEILTKDGEIIRDDLSLYEKILNHKTVDYSFGKVICFKTKMLEIFKKRMMKKTYLGDDEESVIKSEKILLHVVNYASPDFIAIGYKKENHTDLFFGDGKVKRIASTKLIKIKWFNPFQNKYSEHYLPEEFFIDKPEERKFEQSYAEKLKKI